MDIKFVKYTRIFLEKSSGWLNDNEIKKLTMTPKFSQKVQSEWFENLENRTDYYIWGIEYNNIPIGAVGLKHIDYESAEAEYFGYIGEKELWGKGIGKSMMLYIQNRAEMLGIKMIYLRVADYNLRAINLYKKMGYLIIGKDGYVIKIGKKIVK